MIIEDNAHSYSGTFDGKKLGQFGDFSFNSLRKFLPVLGGSQLLINNPIFEKDSIATSFLEYGDIVYMLRKFSYLFPLKHKLQKIKKINSKNIKIKGIDYFSKRVIESEIYNSKSISNRRFDNFKFWKKYLADSELNFIKNDDENKCPYVFPCFSNKDSEINKWLNWGNKNNISIIRWPDFPPGIKKTVNNKLKNIIFFPVNHDHNIRMELKNDKKSY